LVIVIILFQNKKFQLQCSCKSHLVENFLVKKGGFLLVIQTKRYVVLKNVIGSTCIGFKTSFSINSSMVRLLGFANIGFNVLSSMNL